MSWKTVVGIAAAACAVTATSQASKWMKSDTHTVSADAYDAAVVAEYKEFSKQTPKKIEGRDGAPMTILAVHVEARKIVYELRLDDPANENAVMDADDWKVYRAGMVGALCAETVTRGALNHNWVFVYRLHDPKSKFLTELPPIGIAHCPNAA